MMVTTILFVLTRLIAKALVNRTFRIDDYFIIASMVNYLPMGRIWLI